MIQIGPTTSDVWWFLFWIVFWGVVSGSLTAKAVVGVFTRLEAFEKREMRKREEREKNQ